MDTKIKNILCVGFGDIGCRHVQSLLRCKRKYNIILVEPNLKVLHTNLERINHKLEDVEWYRNINSIPSIEYDIAIIATNSDIRFTITDYLITYGIKCFILEKVVFQNNDQFQEIVNKAISNNVQIYINYVRRYYEMYREIKSGLDINSPVFIKVIGTGIGLGSNSVHFLDLGKFLVEQDFLIQKSNLKKLNEKHKRGPQFVEFDGKLNFRTSLGSNMTIIDRKGRQRKLNVIVKQSGRSWFIISEQKLLEVCGKKLVKTSNFSIPFTSELTEKIVEDIERNKCKLTKLIDAFQAHSELFKAINYTLNVNQLESCHIT